MLKSIMSFSLETIAGLTEVVIYDSAAAMQAHRELFRFSRNAYIPAFEKDDSAGSQCNAFPLIANIVNLCSAAETCPARIHLALSWENMLRVAAWKADFASIWDVIILLKSAGVAEAALKPFANASISDLYPYLYYGKMLDVLKRVCVMAKKQTEARLKNTTVRVDSHMIQEDSPRVIASSL